MAGKKGGGRSGRIDGGSHKAPPKACKGGLKCATKKSGGGIPSTKY